jgi:hypothetical protein
MLHDLFAVKVLIKDFSFSDEWNIDMENTVRAIFQNYMGVTNKPYTEISDNEIPLFTKENIESFPVLQDLRNIFVDGFYELANSYENNHLTKNEIEQKVYENIGKLPFVKSGESKSLHNHTKASAFAVFYLSEIDNDKDGGTLILRDPAFHSNYGFHPTSTFNVNTKKNRLVVVPAYVWHEVSPYVGKDERIAVVMNLDL